MLGSVSSFDGIGITACNFTRNNIVNILILA